MGGACCTSKNELSSIEYICKNVIFEKEETLDDLDWKYKIDHTYYIPNKKSENNMKKPLGNDMLKFLDSFNTDCPFNQFTLFKEDLNFPFSTIGIIKSIFSIENDNFSFNREKIGTGILISPLIILTVLQNVYEFVDIARYSKKNGKSIPVEQQNFQLSRFVECKFYIDFAGESGNENEIEDVVFSGNFSEGKITSKDNLFGLCFLVLKNPIGIEFGFVGLPKYLKRENKFNYTKQQSIRESRRENQAVEILGHTFFRVEKKIFCFESKIFSKKTIHNETNKNALLLSGISFDMLPGSPIFFPKNDKKILMGLFSHTQKIINKNNEFHQDSTGGNNFAEVDNGEKNYGLLIEEEVNDLCSALDSYYKIKKLRNFSEIQLNINNCGENEVTKVIEFSGCHLQNLKQLTIKDINLQESESAIYYLEKSFINYMNLKSLTLENNKLSYLELDFKDVQGLTELNLSSNSLGKTTITSICKYLKRLRKLNLSLCALNDDFVNLLAENLNFVDCLNLNNNNFTNYGAISLMNYMKNLKELFISGNNLTDSSLENIENLVFLEVLSIKDNSIGNLGIKNFVEKRKKYLIYLKKVDFSLNIFDNQSAVLFKDILSFFDEIDITGNNLDKNIIQEINKIE